MMQLHKLEVFFSQFKHLHFKKGEAILRPGDIPQGVYYVQKGYIRLYSLSESGQELTLIIFKPGDFFPVIWLINNTHNDYYVSSFTSSSLFLVPKDKFLQFIHSDKEALFDLTSRSLIRLGGLLQRMEYMTFGNAYSKVASILLICANRFGEKKNGGIEIQVPLTHKDIAALLGIARETVSIEMKKFERKGLIEIKNKYVFIKNKALLEKETML